MHGAKRSWQAVFTLLPVSTTVELRAGWNLVGFPAQSARLVTKALASI